MKEPQGQLQAYQHLHHGGAGRKEQEIENLFENIMTENYPTLMKEIEIQVQDAQRVPNKMNPKRHIPRHIIIKMPKAKVKERMLKAVREKQSVTYKGAPIRLSTDFYKETLQARREWQEIFKVMKTKNLQPRLLYPAKLSLRVEGQIKFPTQEKAKGVHHPQNSYYKKC